MTKTIIHEYKISQKLNSSYDQDLLFLFHLNINYLHKMTNQMAVNSFCFFQEHNTSIKNMKIKGKNKALMKKKVCCVVEMFLMTHLKTELGIYCIWNVTQIIQCSHFIRGSPNEWLFNKCQIPCQLLMSQQLTTVAISQNIHHDKTQQNT